MRNILFSIFMGAIVLTMLSGCGGNVENEIIGSWQANSTSFIFNSDNTFEQKDYGPERISRGTYKVIDGNKVRLDYDIVDFDVTHTASIRGDNLKLTNRDGDAARFKRISSSQ